LFLTSCFAAASLCEVCEEEIKVNDSNVMDASAINIIFVFILLKIFKLILDGYSFNPLPVPAMLSLGFTTSSVHEDRDAQATKVKTIV